VAEPLAHKFGGIVVGESLTSRGVLKYAVDSVVDRRHYILKPRPLAVDAFRLCRSDVKNVCK
jgi:hypothetical protein